MAALRGAAMRICGAALAALLIPLAAGCSGWTFGKPAEEVHGEAPHTVLASPVVSVEFEQSVSGLGACQPLPDHEAIVTAAVEGLVAEILVGEGAAVEAGKPIIRLDDRLALADLAEREAARDELRAALATLKAPPREPERRQAELEISRAALAVDVAHTALDKLAPLARTNEIAGQQLFEAQQRLRDAEAARKLAEARREVLLLGPTAEAVAETESRIARAEAAVATAKSRLAYFILKAPRSGVVNAIVCRPGQWLPAGGPAAMLIDAAELLVQVGVPPAQAQHIQPGQQAHVRLRRWEPAEDKAEPLAGQVAFVGWKTATETGLVPVSVRVANDGRLRLGMAAYVEIVIGQPRKSLAVPSVAIVPDKEGPTVVVVRDGKAAIVHVRTGLVRGELTEVAADDLKEGEPVVTHGAFEIEEGAEVKVHEGQEEGDRTKDEDGKMNDEDMGKGKTPPPAEKN